MPSSSHLRIQTAFEPISAETTRSYFVSPPPQKKQKMSLTQTYYIAASARSKLGKEACRADHDLRLLVGHANLLDSLMIELQDAERQQEAWFNQTMAKASKAEESRHIQWADSIAEELEEDDDSESESECEDDFDMVPIPRRIAQAPVQITTMEIDEEEEEFYDDMEDDSDLALTRVPSQSQSPPELVYEEDSDDESPPTSPPQSTLNFSEKEAMLTTSYYNAKSQSQYLEDDHPLFMDTTAPLISSY
ncbi:Nn.00g086980.m01.CDS01 [Neocucurbitaria sp. VM-36]